jgi:hypothetical protein
VKCTNSENIVIHKTNKVNQTQCKTNGFLDRTPTELYSEVRAAGLKGLSNGHITPLSSLSLYNLHQKNSLDAEIEIAVDGQHIKLKTPWMYKHAIRKQAKRGKIQGFTAKSRKRMMIMMSKTDQNKLPIFVTLTYPAIFPQAKETKGHLGAFIKRLKRKYGNNIGYVWKLEKQKRGAPHYHLFIWGIKERSIISFITDSWYEIVKSGDPKHALAGTQVQQMLYKHGLMKYCSKYLAKIDKQFDTEEMGRIWGKGGNIPMSKICKHTLTRGQAIKLLRNLRKRTKQDNPGIRNYFTNTPRFWEDRYSDIIKAE